MSRRQRPVDVANHMAVKGVDLVVGPACGYPIERACWTWNRPEVTCPRCIELLAANDARSQAPSAITRESLEERARTLGAQIKTLPLAEMFRLVADMVDTGQWSLADQTARFAAGLLSLEAQRQNGGA